MKTVYKEYEIEVKREKCLAGYFLLYYTIYRLSDGYECVCDYTDSNDTVRDMIKAMKERIDNELKEDDPWNEKGKLIEIST